MAGISNPYLSQIERGLRKPSAEILQQIARALADLAPRRSTSGPASSRSAPATADLVGEILRDPYLTEDQKKTLVRIYESFRHENGNARRSSAAPARRSRRRRDPAPVWVACRPTMRTLADALAAHVAAGPAGRGRQRRHERLRARAGRLAGPGRRRRRRVHPALGATTSPEVVDVEPGLRVVHVAAGPADLRQGGPARRSSTSSPTACSSDIRGAATSTPSTPTTGCRASPATALKHELDLPLVSTFHTLARVKAETGDPEPAAPGRRRGRGHRLLRRHHRVVPGRGRRPRRPLRRRPRPHRDRAARRRPRLLLARRPGRRPRRPRPRRRPPGAAVRRAHPAAQGPRRRRRARWPRSCARRPDAVLVVVGGAERRRRRRRGRPGARAGRRRSASTTASGSSPPQPHHLLSTYYRAADVVVVPSRSESFGLVALEAAACGTPGRRRRRRRAAHARRRRAHRLPRRGPRPAPTTPPPSRPCSPTRLGRAAMGAAGRRAGRRLHVVDDRRPAAPPLRRPHRPRAWSTAPVDRRRRHAPGAVDRRELDEVEARIDAWAAPPARRARRRRRRRAGRARRAALVRAGPRRGEGRLHHLAHAAPAHARSTRPTCMPAPEENAERALRVPAAPQPRPLRRRLLHRRRGRASSSAATSPAEAVTDAELDRVLGSLYAWTERFFRPMLAIGFRSSPPSQLECARDAELRVGSGRDGAGDRRRRADGRGAARRPARRRVGSASDLAVVEPVAARRDELAKRFAGRHRVGRRRSPPTAP